MKAKHTPGPWNILYFNNEIRIGNMVARTMDNNDVCQANARLIAAAPDLYEACKSFLEDGATPSIDGYNKLINTMKTIITKIEGK